MADGIKEQRTVGLVRVQQRYRSLEGNHFVYLLSLFFIPFPLCCVVFLSGSGQSDILFGS